MEDIRPIPLIANSLEARCEISAALAACKVASGFLSEAGLTPEECSSWELVLAEAASNAVKHCRAEARLLPLRLDLLLAEEWVEVRVTDRTAGFDWPEQAQLPPDDSESGRGVFLIQSLTDEARYLRGAHENCLVLRKKRAGNNSKSSVSLNAIVRATTQELKQTLGLMTEELASAYESLSAIFRFSLELQGNNVSREFIQRWLHQLLAITESDWFVLRQLDPMTRQLRVVVTSESISSENLLPLADEYCLETKAALQRCDIWFDVRSPLSHSDPLCNLAGAGTGFAHPIFVNNTLLGILSMGRRDGSKSFQAAQVSVVQTFGDFLGVQIHSQEMQEEQLKTRLSTRDLEIAANLQRSLLPTELPSVERANLTGFYRSAQKIGGDYYDAIPTADGNILLVVADVMGKGLPAALFTFMFRSLVRSRRDLAVRPGELLVWLNQNLFQELNQAEMFITAQIAFLDCQRGEILVAGAGHPPLLLATQAGGVLEIAADGLPLGIDLRSTFPEERRAFAGCHVLMFTDGLMDATNPQGQQLGLAAVKVALASAARSKETCEAVRERFVRLLQEFEGNTSPADDTAFVIAITNSLS